MILALLLLAQGIAGYGSIQLPLPPQHVTSGLRDFVSVKDFGAKGDGVTDDSAAIQAAFTAVAATGINPGRNLFFPNGTYLYVTPQVAKNLRSITVSGDGNRNTILRYTGASGGTAVKCLNCYRTVFRGIRFDRSINDPVNMFAFVEDSTQPDYDATAPSQLNVIEECTFKNGQVGVAVTFVTSDIMNDSHRFVHNILDGQTTSNFVLDGQNALGLVLEGNYVTASPHAVQETVNAGSFTWIGGYTSSTVSNFDFLGMSTSGYRLIGLRSEASPRFLTCSLGSALPSPITIEGIEYSASSLNVDTFAISTTCGGPYNLIGNAWGGVGGVEANPPRFSIANNATNPIPVVLAGNAFGAPNADAAPPLVASTGNHLCAQGNRYKIGATSVWKTLVEECFASAEREFTITYTSGVAMALDATAASIFKLVVNDTIAVVINSPTGGTAWQSIKVQIKATAVMNAGNPFAGAGWKAGTVPIPTNGNGYIYTFMYDGVSWYQIGTPNLVAN